MVVHLEMKGSLIKEIVKAVENINEECIWNFDSQGLHIRMSDIYKYKMLEIKIGAEDFISYSCDRPVPLGIVIDRIKDVSKTVKTKDILILHSEHDEQDITSDNFITLKANGLSRSVKLIDTDLISEVPSLSGAESSLSKGYSTTVKSEPLSNFLKASSKAIAFSVKGDDGSLIFSSKTDEGLVEVDYDSNDIVLTPHSYEGVTQYSVKEVELATSTMKGYVAIRGCEVDENGEGGLIELKWDLSENSSIKCIVAPRA